MSFNISFLIQFIRDDRYGCWANHSTNNNNKMKNENVSSYLLCYAFRSTETQYRQGLTTTGKIRTCVCVYCIQLDILLLFKLFFLFILLYENKKKCLFCQTQTPHAHQKLLLLFILFDGVPLYLFYSMQMNENIRDPNIFGIFRYNLYFLFSFSSSTDYNTI